MNAAPKQASIAYDVLLCLIIQHDGCEMMMIHFSYGLFNDA
jgi:hypothetical protein